MVQAEFSSEFLRIFLLCFQSSHASRLVSALPEFGRCCPCGATDGGKAETRPKRQHVRRSDPKDRCLRSHWRVGHWDRKRYGWDGWERWDSCRFFGRSEGKAMLRLFTELGLCSSEDGEILLQVPQDLWSRRRLSYLVWAQRAYLLWPQLRCWQEG